MAKGKKHLEVSPELHKELHLKKIEYEFKSIEELLNRYFKSTEFNSAKKEIDKILAKPEMNITIFQDELMDKSGIGWVVRFEFSNTSGNSDISQKASTIMGTYFRNFVKTTQS